MTRKPIDWTGIREIAERCAKTPGHPMAEEHLIALAQGIEKRVDDWRAGQHDAPTDAQMLAALNVLIGEPQ